MINTIIYLEVDDVICDVKSMHNEISLGLPYSFLNPMPDAKELFNYLQCLRHIDIQILTCVSSSDEIKEHELKIEKKNWLDQQNLFYQTNFVRTHEEKLNFANKNSILVDNSIECINLVEKSGGYGVLHTDSTNTILKIENIFKKIQYFISQTT
jgi:hypothetical protein